MIIKTKLLKDIKNYTESQSFKDKAEALAILHNSKIPTDSTARYIEQLKAHKLYIFMLYDVYKIIKNNGYKIADLPDTHTTKTCFNKSGSIIVHITVKEATW